MPNFVDNQLDVVPPYVGIISLHIQSVPIMVGTLAFNSDDEEGLFLGLLLDKLI